MRKYKDSGRSSSINSNKSRHGESDPRSEQKQKIPDFENSSKSSRLVSSALPQSLGDDFYDKKRV